MEEWWQNVTLVKLPSLLRKASWASYHSSHPASQEAPRVRCH